MNQVERCPWCGSEITRAKFEEITAKIRSEEQRKSQAQALQIKKALGEDYKVRLENEKKKALEAAKVQTDKIVKSKLDEQRSILDRERDKELVKKDIEHKRAMEKMQAELREMGRRLEKKTSTELGEGPEIDLYEMLKGEFPDDYVLRVKRGETGADIHQTVKHRGEECGLIIFDSKNRQQWKFEFAKKLRQDQMAAEADHAILSTAKFPEGGKELCIEEDVIVVNPARVTHIVHILREAMIKLHLQGLSIRERKTKVEKIYQWITSDEFAQKLSEAGRLADGLLKLEVKEKKEHDRTWRERGTLLTSLTNAVHEIDDGVYTIIGGKGAEAFDAQELSKKEEVPF